MLKFILFSVLMTAFITTTLGIAPTSEIRGLTLINIAIYLVALILVMTEMAGGKIRRKNLIGVNYALLVIIAVITSAIYSNFIGIYEGGLYENLRQAKSMVVQPALLYIMAFLLIDSRKQGENILLTTVLLMGVFNVVAVIASQIGLDVFQVAQTFDVDEEERKRLGGFTGNPNKTAYLTCVLITFQYYFFKYHDSKLVRLIMAVLVATGVLVIIMSGSRGGMLVLVIILLAIAHKLRDYRIIFAAAISIPILVTLLIYSDSLLINNALERLETLTSDDSSVVTSGRNEIWSELLQDYSRTGTGIVIGNGFGSVKFMGLYAQPHNLYLRILVEFGILGLGIFLFFIVYMFKGIKQLNINSDNNLYPFVAAAGYVVVFAWMFSTLIGVLDLMWFTIGIAVATMASVKVEKRDINNVKKSPDTNSAINRRILRKAQE